MDKCDLCRQDTSEVYYIINQEYEDKLKNDYGMFPGVEVMIQGAGGNYQMVKVANNMREDDRKSIGAYQNNLLSNKYLYEVKYHNVELAQVEYDIISENIFVQVDSERYKFQMLDKIQDRYSNLYIIPQEQGFINTSSGNAVPKKRTIGWELLVEFKDVSSSCINMKDPKQINAVELAEYAAENGLKEDPVFKWWVKDVPKKRYHLVENVKFPIH